VLIALLINIVVKRDKIFLQSKQLLKKLCNECYKAHAVKHFFIDIFQFFIKNRDRGSYEEGVIEFSNFIYFNFGKL